MRINAIVTYGVVRVGMLSLSGNTRQSPCHTRTTDGQVGAPLRRHRRHRFARAAHESNGDRLARAARLRAERAVADRAAGDPVHPGPGPGAALVPAVPPVLRADPAAHRRGTHRGLPPAAVREPGGRRFPQRGDHRIPRRRRRVRLGARPDRLDLGALLRDERNLPRLRDVRGYRACSRPDARPLPGLLMDRLLIAIFLLAAIAFASALVRRREAPAAPARIDLSELGLAHAAGVGVVGFSTSYCLPCQQWEQALVRSPVPFMQVDLGERPDLARRYDVKCTPLILAVSLADGTVVDAFTGDPEPAQLERIEQLAA